MLEASRPFVVKMYVCMYVCMYVRINVVALRQTQLVLGCVTVCGR